MADYILEPISNLGQIPLDDPLTIDDFDRTTEVNETKEYWGWHRGLGRGGMNYGGDFFVPENRVLVGWEATILSEYNTKGDIDWRVVFEKSPRGLLIPRGVHTGKRLTPGDGGGILGNLGDIFRTLDPTQWTTENLQQFLDSGGAAFTGYFKFFYVNEVLWKSRL